MCHKNLFSGPSLENATTLITGWGRRSNDLDVAKAEFDQFRVSTPILQKVRLPVANNKCSKTDFFTINNETQVCAGGVTGILRFKYQDCRSPY